MTYMMLTRLSAALFRMAIVLLLSFSLAKAQNHEIRQEHMDALGWFGGDDRPDSRRNVGVGQLVLIDKAMTVTSFSFHYGANFDFVQKPDGFGHDVTLRLQVRDADGTIRKSTDVAVPASHTSGWVTWENLDVAFAADTRVYFTAYLVGGYDVNPYTSGYSASTIDPYPQGNAVAKHGASDAELDAWVDWVDHVWDAAFRLSGTLATTGISDALPFDSPELHLSQNYPNPLRDGTNFEFSLSRPASVRLEIFNLLGERLHTLLDGSVTAGTHRVDWNNTTLRNGMYAVVLRAGTTATMRMMTVLR